MDNMDIKDAIKTCLEGSPANRIAFAVEALKGEGVETADDLKYIDHDTLESIKGLENMEIKKIMRFVQNNFPDEYQEHKRKRDAKTQLRREKDLLVYRVKKEQEIREMEEELERETRERVEKMRKKKEEFERDRKKMESKTDVMNTFYAKCKEYGSKAMGAMGTIPNLFTASGPSENTQSNAETTTSQTDGKSKSEKSNLNANTDGNSDNNSRTQDLENCSNNNVRENRTSSSRVNYAGYPRNETQPNERDRRTTWDKYSFLNLMFSDSDYSRVAKCLEELGIGGEEDLIRCSSKDLKSRFKNSKLTKSDVTTLLDHVRSRLELKNTTGDVPEYVPSTAYAGVDNNSTKPTKSLVPNSASEKEEQMEEFISMELQESCFCRSESIVGILKEQGMRTVRQLKDYDWEILVERGLLMRTEADLFHSKFDHYEDEKHEKEEKDTTPISHGNLETASNRKSGNVDAHGIRSLDSEKQESAGTAASEAERLDSSKEKAETLNREGEDHKGDGFSFSGRDEEDQRRTDAGNEKGANIASDPFGANLSVSIATREPLEESDRLAPTESPEDESYVRRESGENQKGCGTEKEPLKGDKKKHLKYGDESSV